MEIDTYMKRGVKKYQRRLSDIFRAIVQSQSMCSAYDEYNMFRAVRINAKYAHIDKENINILIVKETKLKYEYELTG